MPHYQANTLCATWSDQLRISDSRHLQTDSHRPKQDRRTALMLFKKLQQEGFTGNYSGVRRYMNGWRDQVAKVSGKSAFVPLIFQLGEGFQFDWSEELLVIGGIHRKLLVAHTKLCASRAFWLVAYPTQSHEMLFDAHTNAFTALGGIARRGIYDNMKTIVDKVMRGKGCIVNARFFAMNAHYLFDPDFCNVASGGGEALSRRMYKIVGVVPSMNTGKNLR